MAKIIEALLDQNTRVRARYLNRLSDLEPEDTSLLVDAWPKISARRRQALLEDLDEIHLADDLQNFEAVARVALRDEEPGVRIGAINILRVYELTDLLPTFMNMAEHDPDPNVRAVAASSLGTYTYMGELENLSPTNLARLEDCLLRIVSSDDSPLVHRKALEALGYSSRKEVNGFIEKAYTSKDKDWLVTALSAMGKSANSHWKPHVLKMLTDESPGAVRSSKCSENLNQNPFRY
jgi:HEAT repeat protein